MFRLGEHSNIFIIVAMTAALFLVLASANAKEDHAPEGEFRLNEEFSFITPFNRTSRGEFVVWFALIHQDTSQLANWL